MTLKEYRDAVVAELKAKLTGLRKVDSHGGRIDLAELRRFAAAAPAVFVAVLGVADAERTSTGEFVLTASVAAFLVTIDKPGQPRDAAGLTLATAILQVVPGNDWGLEEVGLPESIRAENLYTSAMDKAGVTLWGVTWRQKFYAGALTPAVLDDLKTFHADWDVGETANTPEPSDDVTGLDL